MKTISCLLTAGLLYSFTYGGQFTRTKSVKFQTDIYNLNDDNREMLLNFLDSLDYTLDYQFTISGHTDNVGSYVYNDTLSYKRVSTIHKLLLEYGIDPGMISSEFHGEYQPERLNNSEKGRSANRRVDLVFSYYYFTDTEDLKSELSKQYITEYIIDPQKPNDLTGPNGIQLNIPERAFKSATGNLINDNVKLRLVEAIGLESFIANKLTTVSGGRLLESGGMMRLEARDEEGNLLELAEDKEITVSIPDDKWRDGMSLYFSDNGRDWVTSKKLTRQRSKVKTPPRPRMPSFRIDMSGFIVDTTNKPRMPVKPMMPRYPHEPRQESYQADIHWYELLFRKRIIEKHNEWYRQAVDEYYDKISRYDERYKNYKEAMVKYKADLDFYKIKLNIWNDTLQALRSAYAAEMHALQEVEFKKEMKLYEYKLKKWEEDRQAAYDRYDRNLEQAGRISTEDAEEVIGRYDFSIDRLNWCNVDMLVNLSPDQLLNLSVWDNDESEENVLLILPLRKSMVNMQRAVGNKDIYLSAIPIPSGEKVTVFAFKVINGQPGVYYSTVENGEKNLEMNFKTVSYREFREIISGIYGDKKANG